VDYMLTAGRSRGTIYATILVEIHGYFLGKIVIPRCGRYRNHT
jgi:hypothetical protein